MPSAQLVDLIMAYGLALLGALVAGTALFLPLARSDRFGLLVAAALLFALAFSNA